MSATVGSDKFPAAAAAKSLQLYPTPKTAAHQAPLSLGFSRKEYWSRVSLPSLEIFPRHVIRLYKWHLNE